MPAAKRSDAARPAFTRDAGNRLRYRGQGHRGRPSDLRTAAVDLTHAVEALTRSRDAIEVAIHASDRQSETLVADARAQADLALRFTRTALRLGALKRRKPESPRQMKLKLRSR